MKHCMPRISLFLLLSIVASSLATFSFAQDRVGGTGGLITTQGERGEWRVVARSSDETTLRLLRAAFSVHGAYETVESMQAASFGIRIDPVGGAGARLVITSGSPEQTLHTETFAGDTVRAATFKALDRAIFKTSGKPGFFSGRLAFVGEDSGSKEIYTSDPLFGGIVRLTSDNAEAVRPRWSPDGGYIVYTSYKTGAPFIHRLDVRQNRRDVIADFKGTNLGARYSPDGSRIAMVLTGRSNADVWIREANGTLTNLTRSQGLEAAPAWSPDGTRIVYSSDQGGGNQLYVIPSAGGTARRLATNLSGYCAEPDWNPVEPNKILFTAAQNSGFQIAVFDTQTGKSAWITREGSGDAIEGQWLNDGRHIIYTYRRANSRQVKIVDTVTLRSSVVSGNKTNVGQPCLVVTR